MIIVRSWMESQSHRIPRDTSRFKGSLVRLIESEGEGLAPNAQVAEQAPGWVLATHFHREYQFQLFTRGYGTIGGHAIQPLMIHYTSPESGYGPIVAGPEGLSYYTLRPTVPAGACYLPESRSQLQRGLRKRHAMSSSIDFASEPTHSGEPCRIRECIQVDGDGMGAWQVSLGPGGVCEGSRLPGIGARYCFVAAGSMVVGSRVLEQGSISFVHGEPGFELRAGDAGLRVLVMQFPMAATPL